MPVQAATGPQQQLQLQEQQQQQRIQSPAYAQAQMQGSAQPQHQIQGQSQIVQHSVRGEEALMNMSPGGGQMQPQQYQTLQDQRRYQQQNSGQFSTLQQQQFSQQNGYVGGTLSVDTSQRYGANVPRSPSSLGR